MTQRPPRMELADYVRELTQPHTHREHYQYQINGHGTWYGADHVIHVPALLTQLWTNDTHTGSAEDGSRSSYGSRPAARIDALDTAAWIDIEAARWVTDLGEEPRSRDTADIVLQLHGLAASADLPARKAITASVRAWWIRARVVTGWDSPAWHPLATCPQCGERGTLSIRLADKIGACMHGPCGATWDETTIGLLADHIRAESEAERVREPGRGPCWCPLPQPTIENLAILCPRCRSARCRHAVTALNLVVADILLGTTSADLAERHRLARATVLRLIRRVRYAEPDVADTPRDDEGA